MDTDLEHNTETADSRSGENGGARTAQGAFACSEAARARARDFIENETQFHLGFLPTEQSNPITATLEEDFRRSTLAGVQCLQRGDRQIPITMRHVFSGELFGKLVASMAATLSAPVRPGAANPPAHNFFRLRRHRQAVNPPGVDVARFLPPPRC